MNETYKRIDPLLGPPFKENATFPRILSDERKSLDINRFRAADHALEIPHFQVGEGKTLFPMRNHPAQAATQQVKPPADRLDQIRVEAVKAEEFFVLELLRLVDLLAKQHGARVRLSKSTSQ